MIPSPEQVTSFIRSLKKVSVLPVSATCVLEYDLFNRNSVNFIRVINIYEYRVYKSYWLLESHYSINEYSKVVFLYSIQNQSALYFDLGYLYLSLKFLDVPFWRWVTVFEHSGEILRRIEYYIHETLSGWFCKFEIIGYTRRFVFNNPTLVFTLGYTFSNIMWVPTYLLLRVGTMRVFSIFGLSRTRTLNFKKRVLSLRPADPYKGAGIKMFGNKIRLKKRKTRT